MIESLLKTFVKVFGSRNERLVKKMRETVGRINALEPKMKALSDADIPLKTEELKKRLKDGEKLEDILPEAYALVREASSRVVLEPFEKVPLRHFDAQLIGAIALNNGCIAEMSTGEGKTLVATCPAYLNALTGEGVHVVTVNDYLALRDASWMGPIYRKLGLTVGIIQSEMNNAQRREAYACDITYGTNNEFGFDYLRDNMKARGEDQVQRSRAYAIIDEVDNILIDEARTPLIISGPSEGDTRKYYEADAVVRQLQKGVHFEVKEKEQQCILTEEGIVRAQQIVGVDSFYTGSHMQWPHLLEQALRAHNLFHRDVEYMVDVSAESGKLEVIIVDEFTGRLMQGRRWSDGLHQAVEAKERLPIRAESQTLATITFQNFFKLYKKLAGMTGTAMTEAGEFLKIYNLDVVSIPTHRTVIRKDMDDKIYADQKDKYAAIVAEIVEIHAAGRPILVGTTSIEKSEQLSGYLERKGIEHKVLNAKHHAREAEIIAMAGQEGAVTIATNMAGRGTDIKLGPGVAQKGGLHVLGTERHEARRIDNQLRGRCGRQGDPGSTRFYLALDDELMRRFASDNVAAMLKRLGLRDGEAIEHPLINRSIASAQKKVEERNFDIRKNLLEYDNVMNEQRSLIYTDRQRILAGENLKEMVQRMFTAVIDISIPRELGSEAPAAEWNWDGLEKWFQRKTGETIALDRSLRDTDKISELIEEKVREVYEKRELAMTAPVMREVERYLLLNAFDVKWKDHLANMDALKAGIGLRGYAQVDPKVEYKREAYATFEEMIKAIQDEVTDFILRVRMTEEDASEKKKDVFAQQTTQKAEFQAYEQNRKQNEQAVQKNQSAEPAKPFVHKDQKPGRNDPCYCGSGRKYKKCHGAGEPD